MGQVASEPMVLSGAANESARTSAIMLLVALFIGGLLALVMTRLQGWAYIPIVIPALVGVGIGLPLGGIRLRRRHRPRAPLILAVLLASLIAFGGYQILGYIRFTEFLAEQLGTMMDRSAGDPYAEVQRWYEEVTGQQGFLAYLAFTTSGEVSGFSPLGILGGLDPSLPVLLASMAIDACTMAAAGVIVGLGRSRPVERPATSAGTSAGEADAGLVREVIARTDQETLLSAMRAMDRGEFGTAAQILRRPSAEDTHALALTYDPRNESSYLLEVVELGSSGSQTVRTTRRLGCWDGQELWDELRLAR